MLPTMIEKNDYLPFAFQVRKRKKKKRFVKEAWEANSTSTTDNYKVQRSIYSPS